MYGSTKHAWGDMATHNNMAHGACRGRHGADKHVEIEIDQDQVVNTLGRDSGIEHLRTETQ